jgi:hypothetical protein
LRSASGDALVLPISKGIAGSTPDPINFIAQFGKPLVLLRFGETYTVDFGAGLADFAGNVGNTTLTFTTRAAPPLVAADGFESVTDATVGGAQVLSSAAGAPTITGTRSLYIPPLPSPATQTTTQLSLRLAVTPGKTMLRFAYRYVNPTTPFNGYFEVGSVGGSIASAAPVLGGTTTTTATIGGTQVTLGPVATATIQLPADVTDEVAIERITSVASCGLPYPPTPGMIIDDLRVE